MAKAKKSNAASSALAALRGKGKGAKAGKPKKAAPAPKPKKKPKAAPVPAPKPKKATATAGTAVATLPQKPADVYTLVHQCWTLWSGHHDTLSEDDAHTHQMAIAIVTGYGSKYCVPTPHAAPLLEAFRKLLAKEEPEPAKPKPWEPCPPAIQRLIAGECEPGRGTWILHGSLWEFETGWDEPRRKENTEPEDWHHTGDVTPLTTPEGQTNEVEPTTVPASGPEAEAAGEPAQPAPEPEAVAEVMCAIPEPEPASAPTDGSGYGDSEPTPTEPAGTEVEL